VRGAELSTHGSAAQQQQQSAYRLLFHDWIAERQLSIHSIPVAAPATNTVDEPRLLQIAQDLIRIALGDLRSFCNLLDAQIRVCGKSKKHVCVMGDERPRSRRELLERLPLARFRRG
jgi:hypothetical protein